VATVRTRKRGRRKKEVEKHTFKEIMAQISKIIIPHIQEAQRTLSNINTDS
jgi:hypothetical protein